MSESLRVFYPRCGAILRIRLEDFGQKTSQISNQTFDLSVQLKSARVNINDYTQADTFDIEVDYAQFPFDPRSIRAVAVTIAMEDSKELKQEKINFHKNTSEADSNIIFLGFADDESISFDDQKRTVKLEGRDYTALLIDKKYHLGTVKLDLSVYAVIREILDSLEDLKSVIIDDRVGAKDLILAKFWAEKDALSGKHNTKADESYWDVINNIVARAGWVTYFELDKLVISKPRAIYGSGNAKKFIYGHNVTNLSFKRKIGRKKNFNIIVRSNNLKTKEVIEAKIPLEATKEWSEATGISIGEMKMPKLKINASVGAKEEDEVAPYISFRIPDAQNKEHLIRVAQEIYEEIGRQQLEGTFETSDMLVVGQKDSLFNVLKIRNGTPVSISFDIDDLKEITEFSTAADREHFLKIRELKNSQNKQAFARYLSESLGNVDSTFYTKSVEFSLDSSQGFKCKIEFVNFIRV